VLGDDLGRLLQVPFVEVRSCEAGERLRDPLPPVDK
jgi:hypothetical protein